MVASTARTTLPAFTRPVVPNSMYVFPPIMPSRVYDTVRVPSYAMPSGPWIEPEGLARRSL